MSTTHTIYLLIVNIIKVLGVLFMVIVSQWWYNKQLDILENIQKFRNPVLLQINPDFSIKNYFLFILWRKIV